MWNSPLPYPQLNPVRLQGVHGKTFILVLWNFPLPDLLQNYNSNRRADRDRKGGDKGKNKCSMLRQKFVQSKTSVTFALLLNISTFASALASQGDTIPKVHCSVTKVFAILQYVQIPPLPPQIPPSLFWMRLRLRQLVDDLRDFFLSMAPAE